MNGKQLLPLLKQLDLNMSLSTLKRIFKRLGLMRCLARFKPFLSPRAKKLRHQYAMQHLHDGLDMWRRTGFVDEAAIRLDASQKVYVSRYAGEAYRPQCMIPRFLSSKGTCIVWAMIWHGGRSELVRFNVSESEGARGGVTAAIYRDQITKGPLKTCFARLKARWRGYGTPRIVEDNASIHVSAINRSVGHRQGITYANHPPSSPDLNPIENCWAILKRRLAALSPRPTTVDAMFQAAAKLWMEIPQSIIDTTVDSMIWRIQELARTRGAPLPY